MPFSPTDQFGRVITPAAPTPTPSPANNLPTGLPSPNTTLRTPGFVPTDSFGRPMTAGSTPPAQPPKQSRADQIGLIPALGEATVNSAKSGIMSFMADAGQAANKVKQGVTDAWNADQSYKPGQYSSATDLATQTGANAVVTGFKTTRALAGSVLDLTGSLLKHLGISGAVSGELGNMGNVADSIVSTVNPSVVPKLKEGLSRNGDSFNEWAKANPELADTIAGWGQILSAGIIVDQAARTGASVLDKAQTTYKNIRLDAKYPNELGLPQEIPAGTPGADAATQELRNTGQDMINAGEVPNSVDAIPAGTPGAVAANDQMAAEASMTPSANRVPITEDQYRAATKVGIPPRDLAVVDGASPEERQVFNDQLAAKKLEVGNRMNNYQLGQASGAPVIDKADYLQASRSETGKAMGRAARLMDQTPLDVSDAQNAFETRLQQDGVLFTQPMDSTGAASEGLDFSQSAYQNDPTAQKLFNQMAKDFTDANGEMTPIKIITLRRRIANDLDLFGKQKFLTPPVEGAMSTVRDALNQPLVLSNPAYAELATKYAKASGALKELYNFMGNKYAYADDSVLNLRAAELGNRLTGRVPADATRVFNMLDSTASDLGYKSDVNLNRIFHFQDMLNEYYPTPPPNSFQGQIIQGIDNSTAGEVVGAAKDILHPVKLADRLIQKIFSVTPEQRQAVLEDMIKGNTASSKSAVQTAVGAFQDYMKNPTIPGAGVIKEVGNGPTNSIEAAPLGASEAVPVAAIPTESFVPNGADSNTFGKALADKVAEIKSSGGEVFGGTFNPDGTEYTGTDAIATLHSENIPIAEATPEKIASMIKEQLPTFAGSDRLKIGVFAMPDGKNVSLDFNISTPSREIAKFIGTMNNQDSIYDPVLGEAINTGGTGEQVFSDARIKEILNMSDADLAREANTWAASGAGATSPMFENSDPFGQGGQVRELRGGVAKTPQTGLDGQTMPSDVPKVDRSGPKTLGDLSPEEFQKQLDSYGVKVNHHTLTKPTGPKAKR